MFALDARNIVNISNTWSSKSKDNVWTLLVYGMHQLSFPTCSTAVTYWKFIISVKEKMFPWTLQCIACMWNTLDIPMHNCCYGGRKTLTVDFPGIHWIRTSWQPWDSEGPDRLMIIDFFVFILYAYNLGCKSKLGSWKRNRLWLDFHVCAGQLQRQMWIMVMIC